MTGTGPQAIQFGHRTPPLICQQRAEEGLTGLMVAIERDRLRVSDLIGQSGLEMGFAPILEASEITGVLELRDAKAAWSAAAAFCCLMASTLMPPPRQPRRKGGSSADAAAG